MERGELEVVSGEGRGGGIFSGEVEVVSGEGRGGGS